MENLKVKKMTKEESLAMLKLEKAFMGDNVNEDFRKLYDAVEEAINNEIITYQDFIDDTVSYLENIGKEDDSIENRLEYIKNMCSTLIEKYGRKEE